MSFFAKPHSSAVKIVKPTSTTEDVKPPPTPPRKDSERRQCRNVVIYGHCKFQGKGCIYAHPPTFEEAPAAVTTNTSPTLTAAAPAFTPSTPIKVKASIDRSDSPAMVASMSPPATITPQALNAAVFVPRTNPPLESSPQHDISTPIQINHPDDVFTESVQTQDQQVEHAYENGHHERHQQNYSGGYSSEYDNYDYQATTEAMQGMELADSGYFDPTQSGYSHGYDTDPMEESYYGHASVFVRQPLNYLLYTPSMPTELVQNTISSHFVPSSSDLRQTLQEKSENIHGAASIASVGLPEELQGYHTIVPLESTLGERKKFGNWHSTVYRAFRAVDGVPHTLRRVEDYRMMHQAAFGPIETWSQIQHPNIVPIREAFTTKAFGDHSLVVSFAYYPNAKTLLDTHIKQKPPTTSSFQQGTPAFYQNRHHRHQQPNLQHIPEKTLWSYIIQIASAIKKVHDRGLAVRVIDASKILVVGQNRVRIGSCGIYDVLFYDNQQEISYLQQEDMVMLGRLMVVLCTGNASITSQSQMQKALDTIKRGYSLEVQSLVMFLCSKMQKTIDQVLDLIKGRILIEQEEALSAVDHLEGELMGELENARLFRLSTKLMFICERPEFARDVRWSDTGDRYIIKLFRDYVFHQVDEHGNPLLDLTHVLTCLNKLDAGTDEKVMLVARDEQSCLVVSYKEIKACIAGAFDELWRARQGGR
ncbi:hypothetical protein CPB83DRAFT_858474 [Crepidotus variabilis]|uniref:PAN2-PAN3 deadenylation complex subunit PAN3 n=1 Tax=Crepidotus variabilis TaxID=179855 RepID=A0A9P6JMT1_9AGAR|nr:hypothetical protein CPB83DRAFT_858474 [Crepidotus variabilis]